MENILWKILRIYIQKAGVKDRTSWYSCNIFRPWYKSKFVYKLFDKKCIFEIVRMPFICSNIPYQARIKTTATFTLANLKKFC